MIFCCSLVRVGDAGLIGVDLWSFIYQHEENSSWLLVSTSDGSVLLRGSSSLSDLGFRVPQGVRSLVA